MVTRKAKPKSVAAKDQLTIAANKDTSDARRLAEVGLDPAAHGMAALRLYNKGSFGAIDTTETYLVMQEHAKAAKGGDITRYRAMLAMQADALNSIFTEMARRAACNMGEYINASQLYLRLGLKAQAQCRSTIEALDRLTTGHLQTVKHVHVNEGGQAVIAEEFHHHTGGQENVQIDEQPLATGAAGASSPLLGTDPLGQGMPIPSHEGQAAMQDARRV